MLSFFSVMLLEFPISIILFIQKLKNKKNKKEKIKLKQSSYSIYIFSSTRANVTFFLSFHFILKTIFLIFFLSFMIVFYSVVLFRSLAFALLVRKITPNDILAPAYSFTKKKEKKAANCIASCIFIAEKGKTKPITWVKKMKQKKIC